MGAYTVEYHVAQQVYFERNGLPPGADVAEIWSRMDVFGDQRALGSFWHVGRDVPTKPAKVQLGSPALIDPLLMVGPEPICGGGIVARLDVARDSILDADFYFAVGDESRWQTGETLPDFLLSVSGQWFERAGPAALAVLKRNFEILDRSVPLCGFVDLCRPEDCFAGMAYGSTWMQRLPLHRWVEQGNWVYAGSKKGDRVRGIYWGNYFGLRILRRLGGRADFVRRYREHARLADGSPNGHIWEFANGVFLSLCLDPLGCKPGAPLDCSAMFNLQWLHKELGARGALCGWDGDDRDCPGLTQSCQLPTASASSEDLGRASQTISELNDAEVRWVEDCIAQARSMVCKYHKASDPAILDPTALDGAFAGWLREWGTGKSSEEPNSVVNSIGLAFGQWLVDRLTMEWAVIADGVGTDMGVVFGPRRREVQVFPTHIVARRLEARETAFLQRLYDATCAHVAELRAQGVGASLGPP